MFAITIAVTTALLTSGVLGVLEKTEFAQSPGRTGHVLLRALGFIHGASYCLVILSVLSFAILRLVLVLWGIITRGQ